MSKKSILSALCLVIGSVALAQDEQSFVVYCNEQNFEKEVLKHEGLVVVKFGAKWCPPCQLLHEILLKASSEFKNQMKVVEVDANESLELFKQYDVEGLPTQVFFLKGAIVTRFQGLPISIKSENREEIVKNGFENSCAVYNQIIKAVSSEQTK